MNSHQIIYKPARAAWFGLLLPGCLLLLAALILGLVWQFSNAELVQARYALERGQTAAAQAQQRLQETTQHLAAYLALTQTPLLGTEQRLDLAENFAFINQQYALPGVRYRMPAQVLLNPSRFPLAATVGARASSLKLELQTRDDNELYAILAQLHQQRASGLGGYLLSQGCQVTRRASTTTSTRAVDAQTAIIGANFPLHAACDFALISVPRTAVTSAASRAIPATNAELIHPQEKR